MPLLVKCHFHYTLPLLNPMFIFTIILRSRCHCYSPFYSQENWESEQLSHLPKVTWLESKGSVFWDPGQSGSLLHHQSFLATVALHYLALPSWAIAAFHCHKAPPTQSRHASSQPHLSSSSLTLFPEARQVSPSLRCLTTPNATVLSCVLS